MYNSLRWCRRLILADLKEAVWLRNPPASPVPGKLNPIGVWFGLAGCGRLSFVKHRIMQRFSNWGPRTKGGPRRVPMGSARGFRKVVIICTVFNNLRPVRFQICKHKSVNQSQCNAWKCCRGLARQAFCWCLLVVLRVICWLLWRLVHPFCGRWCCG